MKEDDDHFSRKNFHILIPIVTTFSSLLLHVYAAKDNGNDFSVMAKLAKSLYPTPSGWYGVNPCKWTGVSCNSLGRITSITLISKFLSGELPSELTQLSDLKSLSLQRNKLSGAMPPFTNLSSLEELYLDNNNFSSIPPLFLSRLTNLQFFSISDNQNLLPWTIPNSLSESTSLVTFLAAKSNIIGTIPDIFDSFPNLRNLRLSYNNLTGTLPSSFAKSGIEKLWLNNQVIGLSGRIDVIGTMTQLTQAWLHVNKFTGPIPDLSECTSLFDLQIRDNELTGVIPPSLTLLPKLANVSLQNNKFQGPIPIFPKGVHSTLGFTNSFCLPTPGPCAQQVTALLAVAGALGYPMALAESWAGNNPCDDWNYISCDSDGRVNVINLGKHNWSGTISPAIASLTSLKTLLLNDNSLTGSIPTSLTSLDHLQLLDISNNNISGKLPSFRSHVTVKTSGNPLLGKDLPSKGGNDSSDNNSPIGSSSSGTNNTPASATNSNKNSISPWLIVGIVIIALIFIAFLCLVIYRRCVKKRDEQNKLGKVVVNSKKTEIKDSWGISTNQSSGGNSDILVYDNPNVTIPIEVLREVTNNFSEYNILGRGGFGVVYKGQLNDGTIIAVKRMESSAVSTKGQNEFKAEIEVLTKVRHRHLVALHGFCVNGNERLLVYEYMPYGTLGQHLFSGEKIGFPPLSWKQRVTIALDVARGVEYLHSLAQQSFIHRDLKSSNILLGDNMRAKVSDFGLVKNAPDGKYSVETRLAGTFGYLAPEYAATGRVTTKVDVFAFGVVLMELITGRKALDESLPEDESHLVSWYRKILVNKDKIIKTIDPTLDPDDETIESICKVAELAGHCTSREPYQRPDMSHAVNVLSPLVELWKPANEDETEGSKVGYHTSLPQALKKWQDNESTTMMTDDFSLTPTSTASKPSGFANTFNSGDAR